MAIPVQVGGGIRDLDTLSSYLDSGDLYQLSARKRLIPQILLRALA